MIKLVYSIFISSDNFFINYFTYINMSKDLSTKYCQDNEERLQKKSNRYQSLSKEER